jgi:hypothetical protein
MIYKAESQFTEALLALPESGMGYQLIDARRAGRYNKDRFIVYNSELIVEYDAYFEDYKRDIKLQSYERLVSISSYLALDSVTLVSRNTLYSLRMFTEATMHSKGRKSGGTGAIENDPIIGNGIDVFVRLSAYADDKRIDFVKKRLKDGSYTTTLEDYLTCKKYDDDPIDRYALPNDEKIKFAFYIKPEKYDRYRPGIVQPANKHNGGGIEALFDNGTTGGTYLTKSDY